MISTKIIKDSIAPHGRRLTTFELEYPRFIHSEVMTHRALSKNAASSRAIPISFTIKQIQENPAMPVFWGKNQAGMSAKEEVDNVIKDYSRGLDMKDGFLTPRMMTRLEACKEVWLEARDAAIEFAEELIQIGLHKQIANRILEPWVMIKIVATATDDGFSNLFHLRRRKDAQPEFQAVANSMFDDYQASTPTLLLPGQWHLPYVDDVDLTLEDQLKLSASLCAQISYRKADESVDKAIKIYDQLVTSEPVHASPFEHQGTPAGKDTRSGNFTGWTQHRQLIPRNVCLNYDGKTA